MELKVKRSSQSVVTGASVTNNNVVENSSERIYYVSSVTLKTQTPHLVKYDPRDVHYR